MNNQTPFVEADILLAVMNDDEEKVKKLFEMMTYGELCGFIQECRRVCDLTEKELIERDNNRIRKNT
jgi:hypothetical protein